MGALVDHEVRLDTEPLPAELTASFAWDRRFRHGTEAIDPGGFRVSGEAVKCCQGERKAAAFPDETTTKPTVNE
jgi:hypothetical protein